MCKQCGTEFALDPKNSRQAYCSTACVAQASRKGWPSSKIYIVECEQCAGLFISRRHGTTVCSAKCRRDRWNRYDNWRYHNQPERKVYLNAASHARRAHKLGLGNTHITLTYLIQRDGGKCRATVCHFRSRKVAKLGTRGPRQPTIDHIVPLSRGGTHTLDNTHLTHYRCNLSKNNRGGGEQLLLIG